MSDSTRKIIHHLLSKTIDVSVAKRAAASVKNRAGLHLEQINEQRDGKVRSAHRWRRDNPPNHKKGQLGRPRENNVGPSSSAVRPQNHPLWNARVGVRNERGEGWFRDHLSNDELFFTAGQKHPVARRSAGESHQNVKILPNFIDQKPEAIQAVHETHNQLHQLIEQTLEPAEKPRGGHGINSLLNLQDRLNPTRPTASYAGPTESKGISALQRWQQQARSNPVEPVVNEFHTDLNSLTNNLSSIDWTQEGKNDHAHMSSIYSPEELEDYVGDIQTHLGGPDPILHHFALGWMQAHADHVWAQNHDEHTQSINTNNPSTHRTVDREWAEQAFGGHILSTLSEGAAAHTFRTGATENTINTFLKTGNWPSQKAAESANLNSTTRELMASMLEKEQKHSKTIEHLDRLLSRVKTPEDIVVHRTVRGKDLIKLPQNTTSAIGATFQDKGYVLTHLNQDDVDEPERGDVSMTIRVPKGTPAAYVDHPSLYDQPNAVAGDGQLLLHRGLHYKVHHITHDEHGHPHMVVEVIPHET